MSIFLYIKSEKAFGITTNSTWNRKHIIIQGVTEIQEENWTMPIKTKNKTIYYKNDKKRLTA